MQVVLTLRFGRVFLLGILAAEAFYAAGGVQQFLLAGKERMAIRADFYVDVAAMSRARAKAMATRTHDANFVISGMNSCFHDLLPLYRTIRF